MLRFRAIKMCDSSPKPHILAGCDLASGKAIAGASDGLDPVPTGRTELRTDVLYMGIHDPVIGLRRIIEALLHDPLS